MNYVQELRLRNEKALEYVINKYYPLVEAIVRKHLSNMQHLHEECISDTFMGCWENIERHDSNKNNFKNWICAIAKYKAIDYLRKDLKTNSNIKIDEVIETLQDDNNCPEKSFEFQTYLDSMLNCLKHQDKEIFIRLFIDGESVKQVSLNTGLKEGTIYNKVSEGRKLIRKERDYQNEK